MANRYHLLKNGFMIKEATDLVSLLCDLPLYAIEKDTYQVYDNATNRLESIKADYVVNALVIG